MRFCANPKCKFYEVTRWQGDTATIVLDRMPPPYNLHVGIATIKTETLTETRIRHKWKSSKDETEWFFCAVCHGAALIVKDYDN